MKTQSFRQVVEHLRSKFGEGVAIEHVWLFSLIMDGITYSGDLTRNHGVTRPALSRGVLRLEKLQLITMEKEGQGRRFHLTPAGRDLALYLKHA
jgi:DNA-binding MarR family transcriptional regulator